MKIDRSAGSPFGPTILCLWLWRAWPHINNGVVLEIDLLATELYTRQDVPVSLQERARILDNSIRDTNERFHIEWQGRTRNVISTLVHCLLYVDGSISTETCAKQHLRHVVFSKHPGLCTILQDSFFHAGRRVGAGSRLGKHTVLWFGG